MAGYGLDDADMARSPDLKSNELDFMGSVWSGWIRTSSQQRIFMKVFGEQMTRIAPLPYKVSERIMRADTSSVRQGVIIHAGSEQVIGNIQEGSRRIRWLPTTWDRVEHTTSAVVSLDFVKLLGRISDIHKDLALAHEGC